MMSELKLLLRSQPKSQFVKWYNDSFGGSMGTRNVRFNWFQSQESSKIGFRLQCQNIVKDDPVLSPIVGDAVRKYGLTFGRSKDGLYWQTSNDWDKDDSPQFVLSDLLDNTEYTVDKAHDDHKFRFLRNQDGEATKENLIVEFSSPNIAKPLHMGHMRSTVTGHSISRICKAAGHSVTNVCFLGDWGVQFGVLQAGLAKMLPRGDLSALKSLSIQEFLACYVKATKDKDLDPAFAEKISEYSIALEQEEETAMEIWKVVRDKTIDHLTEFWATLDIHFDLIQGESQFTTRKDEYTAKVIKLLEDSNLIEKEADGCVFVVLPNHHVKDKKRPTIRIPLIKSDGTSLYILRDTACALFRENELKHDKVLYVVDSGQSDHFCVMFNILSKLGFATQVEQKWDNKLRHVKFGKILGMSTRSGNFVLLSDVLKEGTYTMQKSRDNSPNTRLKEDMNIARELAISSLIISSLRIRRTKDLSFDWHEALKSTGNTGVSLQYNHARLCSLESKVGSKYSGEFDIDYVLNDQIALDLAVALANFEDTFWESYSALEPQIMEHYLYKLSEKSSKALKELSVLHEPDNTLASTRFRLFTMTRKVLAAGFYTLGIRPLKEM